MKFGNAGIAVALLLAAAGTAQAEMLDDCRQGRDSALRLQACSAIIATPSASLEDRATALRNRGAARLDAGAGDLAIADFTEALAINPKDANALTSRGHARVTRGNEDGAIEDFSAAIALVPGSSSYLINRGYAYTVKAAAVPAAIDLAIADFEAAIVLKPESASAYNQRGLAWRKKGDLDRAIADYTTAIGHNPVYALAYNNRGYAYEAKGDKRLASEDFVRALLLDGSLVGASAGLKRMGGTGPLASESDAMVAKGKALVEANCSRCHATGATGDSPNPKAPWFRAISQRHRMLALREPLSRGIAATHDEMPSFKFTDADIDTIIAYINSLPAASK
ncbi:MAG: tetratricopeptide repeat protein [Hyphomicrobiaceae bacterium]